MAEMDGGMIQALMGAGQAAQQKMLAIPQMAIGFFGGRRARKALEGLQSPTYTPAKSISDYYTEAKQRYNQSPYASTLYNTQQQNIGRNVTRGIAGLQSRRMGIGGISSLIQGANDASLNSVAAAEQQKEQRFGQFGQASGAMAGEERQAFNINKMMPYERRYNMLAQKAQGYNQMFNAGLSNYFGGAQTGAITAAGAAGNMSGQSNPYYAQQDYASHEAIDRVRPSTYKVPLAQYGN
jgi:hypothetical protein